MYWYIYTMDGSYIGRVMALTQVDALYLANVKYNIKEGINYNAYSKPTNKVL